MRFFRGGRTNWLKDVSLNILFCLIIGIALIPLVWAFITSIFPKITTPESIWQMKPNLSVYIKVWWGGGGQKGLYTYYLNSLIVTGFSLLGGLLVGVPAAYALTRLRIQKKGILLFFILAPRLLPPAVTVIPLFIMMSKLRLIDTYPVLIIPYSAFNVTLVVWMMRAFFTELPFELEDAALIDGCNRLQAIYKIILPLAAPGIFSTTLVCLVYTWNEFLYALVLTRVNVATVPLALSIFKQEYSVDWPALSAAALLMTFPVLVFMIIMHRYLTKGLTFGATKG